MKRTTSNLGRIYQGKDRAWYFKARDRKVFGPFHDADEADRALQRHINDCQIRHSYSYSIGWPRSWNLKRFARRSAQETSVTN